MGIRLAIVAILLITAFLPKQVSAQLTLSGQLRARPEFKNGQGSLRLAANEPGFFISQRSRLSFRYKQSRVIFHTTIQDVRIWGQDASTITGNDGARLGVHEAWAEVILTNKKDGSFNKPSVDYFSIKTGRQELNYDDGRLLGDHDWLQQGRRHDILVVKLLDKGWQVDGGLAINRNTDVFNFNGTYYTPSNIAAVIKDSRGVLVATPANILPLVGSNGNSSRTGGPYVSNPASTNRLFQNYKSLQFLYVAKQTENTKWSGLLLVDHFGKSRLDSVLSSNNNNLPGYVYGQNFITKGTNGRFTTGLFVDSKMGKQKNTRFIGGIYYQGGEDISGNKLSAYMVHGKFNFTVKKSVFSAGLDYLTGDDAHKSLTKNNRFDPLYGSPHEYWGYMDYFYSSSGSAPGGLLNPHIKWQYTSENKRFTFALTGHYFALANKMVDNGGKDLSSYLGTEIDLSWIYTLNKITSVEWGSSALFATKTMEYAKGIAPGTAKLNANWIFIQLNVKPEFIVK